LTTFELNEDWLRVQIVDPHDAIPFAVSYAAIDKVGQIWIYAEFPFEDLEKVQHTSLSVPDYGRIMREIEGRLPVHDRIADPYFINKRYSNTGKTLKQEFADIGIDYLDGDTSGIDVGHKRVREYLTWQKQFPLSGTNHPKLHIFKSCRNHWRSMLRYKRKMSRSGEMKDKIVIDETYKHFCDNIRHLVMKKDLLVPVLGAETGGVTVRKVGTLGDVHIEYEDDSRYSPGFRQAIGNDRE